MINNSSPPLANIGPVAATGAADRKVMSSSVAIVTAVCFGAASALLSFAIDRGFLAGGDSAHRIVTPPGEGHWDLRGTLTPTDSPYQVPATPVDRLAPRRQA